MIGFIKKFFEARAAKVIKNLEGTKARENNPIKVVEYEEVKGHRESIDGKGGLAILFDSNTSEYFVRYRDGWSETLD